MLDGARPCQEQVFLLVLQTSVAEASEPRIVSGPSPSNILAGRDPMDVGSAFSQCFGGPCEWRTVRNCERPISPARILVSDRGSVSLVTASASDDPHAGVGPQATEKPVISRPSLLKRPFLGFFVETLHQ